MLKAKYLSLFLSRTSNPQMFQIISNVFCILILKILQQLKPENQTLHGTFTIPVVNNWI